MTYEITHAQDWPVEGPAEQTASVNPLLLVHRWLRGRYALAVLLGVALAVPCAVLGYIAIPPKYTSVGRIHIAPTQPFILFENEYNQPLSTFDSFVQSEKNTLESWQVIDFAMQNPDLLAAGWPAGPDGAVELMEGLSVSAPTRGQDILVYVSHEDPKLAKAGVDAVLTAYERISIDSQAVEYQATIQKLSGLVNKFRSDRQRARDEAFRIAEVEGTDDLDRRRAAKHEQVELIEGLITQYSIELVPYAGLEQAAGAAMQGGEGGELPPVELLAETDPTLRRMLDQKRAAEMEIDSLIQRYAPEHRAVLQAEENLATLDRMIEARAELVAGSPRPERGPSQVLTPAMRAASLRAQLAELRRMRDQAEEDAKRLGKLALSIAQKREEADRAQEQLELAQARLEALEVELRNGTIGRISIAQKGSPPIAPSTDRRIPLAVLGALGGAGVGVSMVALIGFLVPKYRYIGDLQEVTRNVFIFGAVPELDAADPESRELVAASVHQVRSVLDARLLGTSDRALVHLVTSAGAADGKSTIALRLAKSFAATGRKTLLIDSDMIGCRLSHEFALVGAAGFADAVVRAETPGSCVHETPIRDLHLMPSGRTDRVDPEQVSARRAEALLAALHHDYQAIVVDTGPILGSLEAQAISAVADEVLLVVTRGREVRQVKVAIDRLHQLGARKIGVVFNRATRQDVERSTSISVTSQRAADVRARWNGAETNGHAAEEALVGDDTTA